MPERTHLSIGEVLSLLREEFPDVTISKIRFLESQGLVDPERTPSGYRKFYDHDVDRLRWILRQQREHFLPLKVIRGRLSEGADRPSGTGRPATVEHTDEHPALAPPRPRGAGVEAERPPAPVTALRPPADADHSDDEPAPVPPLGQTADNGRAGSAIPSSAPGERGVMGESDAGAAGAGERDPG
ncbi:MAG TPA: MerR family transcriptional regulator, partial [Acidimicrobiales bacterium]